MKKYITVILLALLSIGFIPFAIWKYLNNPEINLLNTTVAVLTITTFIFSLYFIKKQANEIKEGKLVKDELTQKVKVYAGHYSFMASFYLWCLIYFTVSLSHINITEIMEEVFMLGLLGSVIIYLGVYYYLKATGNFYEK